MEVRIVRLRCIITGCPEANIYTRESYQNHGNIYHFYCLRNNLASDGLTLCRIEKSMYLWMKY
ncbi:hypothetical protein EAJ02_01920 [Phocaeicola dorei]|nr:hypothetical protein EAJ02_01920 [Phocaeicola dorei]